ncbi:MAG: hypothetical protein U0S36_12280 [Candidatus Nanopelagicales bacterium]
MYHNRGTSTFAGEDSEYGDFPSGDRSSLDDLWDRASPRWSRAWRTSTRRG